MTMQDLGRGVGGRLRETVRYAGMEDIVAINNVDVLGNSAPLALSSRATWFTRSRIGSLNLWLGTAGQKNFDLSSMTHTQASRVRTEERGKPLASHCQARNRGYDSFASNHTHFAT